MPVNASPEYAKAEKEYLEAKTPEAQIVLGAAVIDDVMGLIILAIVSAIATLGSVSLGIISIIFLKAILFLVGAIFIGQILASFFGKMLSKIHTGVGMKLVLALSFAFIFSYIAGKMGLAPIVGAFAAGLVLDPVHFKFFKKPKISEELDEKSKKFGLSQDGMTRSWEKTKQELEKCILVCSNCHREIHAGLLQPSEVILSGKTG
jgi:Kef-type K+ transport system membrane component KefB